MAACLWSDGLCSHRAAAALYELPIDERILEITTTQRGLVPRNGIVVHTTDRLPESQRTSVRGIPSTAVERTLLDLGSVLPRRRVAICLDQSLFKGLTTLGQIDHCLYLTARRGRRGCRTLRELLHQRIAAEGTPESPLETVIYELIARAGLPIPVAQQEIVDRNGAIVARVDFLYTKERLILEGHSKRWHSGFEAQAHDAKRHAKLTELGYRVLYITWGDATQRAQATVALISSLLEDVESPAEIGSM